MTQGNLKKKAPAKAKAKSEASQKKSQKLSKGRKSFNPKGRTQIEQRKEQAEISKAINRKNEAIVSAKAMNAGSKFFCSDVKTAGTKQLEKSLQEKTKHENKATKLSDRLKEQLKKMGKDL